MLNLCPWTVGQRQSLLAWNWQRGATGKGVRGKGRASLHLGGDAKVSGECPAGH